MVGLGLGYVMLLFFNSSQIESADEKKTVLTCPRAVGPVQIVTHGSLAKVLLASTSIEGVYYYTDVHVLTGLHLDSRSL